MRKQETPRFPTTTKTSRPVYAVSSSMAAAFTTTLLAKPACWKEVHKGLGRADPLPERQLVMKVGGYLAGACGPTKASRHCTGAVPTSYGDGSPGRTRTCDQPVTRPPIFRLGLDYLITRLRVRRGCRALSRRYWTGSAASSLCTFLPTR